MEVKVFKLYTGEELIAQLEKEEDGMLFLRKPLGIGIDHEQGRLVFVPYMHYTSASEEIVMPVSSLLFEPLTPVDSIANDYANAVGAVVAPRRSIIRPVGT